MHMLLPLVTPSRDPSFSSDAVSSRKPAQTAEAATPTGALSKLVPSSRCFLSLPSWELSTRELPLEHPEPHILSPQHRTCHTAGVSKCLVSECVSKHGDRRMDKDLEQKNPSQDVIREMDRRGCSHARLRALSDHPEDLLGLQAG